MMPTAAWGHDQLVEISPTSGTVIEEARFDLVLTFSGELLNLQDGNNAALETQLADSKWVSHPIEIKGNQLIARLQLDESGVYQVRWKAVSADGHPIEGESEIEVNLPEAGPTEDGEVVIAPNPEPAEQSADLTGFYIGLAMVIVGAVLAPLGLRMRRGARKS